MAISIFESKFEWNRLKWTKMNKMHGKWTVQSSLVNGCVSTYDCFKMLLKTDYEKKN